MPRVDTLTILLRKVKFSSRPLCIVGYYSGRARRGQRLDVGLDYAHSTPMLLDLAQPSAFLLSILSLASVFQAAFLLPAATLDERLHAGLLRLALAAAIAMVAGLIFREADVEGNARFDAEFRAHFGAGFAGETAHPSLFATLPLQLFCWATGVMVVLFVVSWYIESYGV